MPVYVGTRRALTFGTGGGAPPGYVIMTDSYGTPIRDNYDQPIYVRG